MEGKKKNTGLILGITAIIVTAAAVVLIVLLRPGGESSLAQPSGQMETASPSVPVSASVPPSVSSPPAAESPVIISPSDETSGPENFVVSLIDTNVPQFSESEKLGQIDFSNRMFSPVYNPTVTLNTADGLDGNAKTAAPWTCVVTPDGDQTKTFNLSFKKNVTATKIVWQVSLFPFDGGPASLADKPGGLLLSGELSKSAASFTVDFAKVYAADRTFYHPLLKAYNFATTGGLTLKPNLLPELAQSAAAAAGQIQDIPLRTYYVRAYPADSAGNSIGDAGTGLPVLYGDPLVQRPTGDPIQSIALKFSLMPARKSGTVTYGKEFPNDFVDWSEVTMYNSSNKTYAVLPSGFPTGTEQLLLQVSLSDFSASSNDWNSVPGLVYETRVASGDPVFKALSDSYTLGISIDFSGFVPADSALPDKEFVRYYVRTVALRQGVEPGSAIAAYSETVIVNYGKYQTPDDFKYYETIYVKPMIPTVESMTFTPVHWEAYDWQYHYVVTRQPTEKEVFLGWGSDTPYAAYTVGTKIDFTPVPEDKSWWEEAWNAISGFFSSLKDFVAKIVNWVSNAYADLKSGIINIAVSALPDSWQGPMRTALTALADYGLASIGIPPTLPNFDELASMGTDYLATVAMEQAGIPAGSIIEYGAEELAGKIGNELTSSAGSASPNPMNWNFVKLDPDYIYKPAYITLVLYNPYDEPTPAGKLSFTADKFMDMKQNGYDKSITRLYALYGSPFVCLFKPVYGMEIPALAPHQRLTVPVILEPYVGMPLPGCTAPVSTEGFQLMYGLGEYDFRLNIGYDLPPVSEEAKKQGYTKDAIYVYSATGNGFSFSHDPYDSYSK